MRLSTLWPLAVALLALAPTTRAAAVCDDLAATPASADEAKTILFDLGQDKCLGGQDKPCIAPLEPLCRRLDTLTALPADPDDPTSQQPLVDGFLDLAPELVASLDRTQALAESLATEMRRQFVAIATEGAGAAARARFNPVDLTYFPNEPTAIDLGALLDRSCPAACAPALRHAIHLSTVASLYRRALGKLTEAGRLATLSYLDGLDSRWQAYFASARSQFPWELAVNSAVYQRSPTLAEPPDRQWILAHPDLVFEVATDADNELEEALSLEIVGFHRWRYEGNRLRRPFGVSLLATWRGSADNEVGYGLILHLPRSWSLGATLRDDDEASVVLSADLAKLVTNQRGLYERVFE